VGSTMRSAGASGIGSTTGDFDASATVESSCAGSCEMTEQVASKTQKDLRSSIVCRIMNHSCAKTSSLR